MANGFLQPRGSRLNLNAKGLAGTIKAGQVYLLTDENRIAIGTSTTTYETYAKQSESGATTTLDALANVVVPSPTSKNTLTFDGANWVNSGNIFPLHTPGTNIKTGVLIPLYQYPGNIYTNIVINNLIGLIRKYQDVPVTIIINPNNGSGTVVDENYAALLKRLQGAGATVLGYVATTYGAKASNLVQADVNTWRVLYPSIDGIFVDEMANTAGLESYYVDLTKFCHDKNLYPVVGNPGAALPESYLNKETADIWVIYEIAGYPAESILAGDYGGGYADYSYHRRAVITYNVTHNQTALSMIKKYAGWVYFTNDNLPNPYDTLSNFLESTLIGLSNLYVGGGTSGSIQYNNNGVLNGAALAEINDGSLALVAETTPVNTLAATYFKFVNWLRAGMGARLSIQTSDTSTLQILSFDNIYSRCSKWFASGNSTTINLDDSTALTVLGAVTAVNFASTSLYTQIRKLEYLVTTAATNAIASYRTILQWYRGDAIGKGGFRHVVIWGPATGVATATSRAFVGMLGSAVNSTDVEPSTQLQCIGMGWDAADVNIQMMANGAAGIATKTDLGASFPVPVVDRSIMYRLELYCAPFSTSIGYTVTNLNTNIAVSGTLTVNLPSNTTLLGPRGYMSAGGTSSVIGIVFAAMSVQTSY